MIAPNFYEMNNERLGQIIERMADDVQGQPGYWEFHIEGRKLVIVSDENHNRMRCMTPVADESQLSHDLNRCLLSANFDRALDAKYAIAQELLWSLFTHPLRELTESQLIDAVQQVKALADNFGTSFSSSDIVFGGID